MNRIFLITVGLIFALSGKAQIDTTGIDLKKQTDQGDTIRVGNLLIVRSGGDGQSNREKHLHVSRRHGDYHPSNVSTNWGIVDIGVANFRDKTDYASAAAQSFAPGSNKDWFKLRSGKSVDVNIWVFMQRVNLIKHVVNLKYGLGIELNNYRFEDDIRFKTSPTKVIMDTIHYSKNKLAVDYVTVPFLLNFNFTPHRRQDFGFSVGASVGYKYSSRQKFKSSSMGKEKTFDDFDLEAWKISYIGELQLGLLKLYGSYAARSMFSKGLDMRPYTVGIRLGNW